jgi:hypothetical protein
MRPATQEQFSMHVPRFLALSAVYFGLTPGPGVTQARSPDQPGLAAHDDAESDGCCCEAA